MASMLKMFGVDPSQIVETARKTGEAVKEIAAALEQIQRNQKLIAEKLGIELEGNENGKLLTVAAGTGKIGR